MSYHPGGLTPAQIAFRKNSIGGSDSNIILSGDSERILHLWRLKRGEVEPDNLDDVLPVQMGNATEDFNRWWFTRRTGIAIERAGEEMLSFEYPFMSGTFDGVTVEPDPAYLDAKHVNAFAKEAETLAKYTPQLHHNMIVAGLNRAVLSVFYGTLTWRAQWIEFDPIYAAALLDAEMDFWDCVQTGRPPVALPTIEAPVAAVKIVSFTGNNAWADNAYDWLKHKADAKKFEDAATEIKKLIEADVQEASGHGIKVVRSKSNSLSIKAIK
jgi:predicted phage-related endonuclease